jgi:hypothetical protein
LLRACIVVAFARHAPGTDCPAAIVLLQAPCPKTSKLTVVVAAIAVILSAARLDAGAPIAVTQCGQTVRGPSELTGNLDCTDTPADNALNIRGGSLAMNGFTIKGGLAGVQCVGPCRITGPGTITEASYGIQGKGKLDLRGVDITANTLLGVPVLHRMSRHRSRHDQRQRHARAKLFRDQLAPYPQTRRRQRRSPCP